MAYDAGLQARIEVLVGRWPLERKQMFGGMAYFVRGNMCFAIMGSGLLFRVGRERAGEYLARPGIHEAKMGARTMRQWALAEGQVVADDKELYKLLIAGRDFALGLPPL